ncbi:hypothetical protein IW262DRAFT_737794 [Armillaria fumosa]|nr:hypothetical protein IW262DRAFT_737794 [Armillaria fumosa]
MLLNANFIVASLLCLLQNKSSERNDVACNPSEIILAFDFSTLAGLSTSPISVEPWVPSWSFSTWVFHPAVVSQLPRSSSTVYTSMQTKRSYEYMYAVLCSFIKDVRARTVRMGLQPTIRRLLC